MIRRSGFMYALAQYQREQARATQAQLRTQSVAAREAERARKAYERARLAQDKEAKRLYLESRSAEVEHKNDVHQRYINSLDGILAHTLTIDDYFDLDRLKDTTKLEPFDPGHLATPSVAPDPATFAVAPLS